MFIDANEFVATFSLLALISYRFQLTLRQSRQKKNLWTKYFSRVHKSGEEIKLVPTIKITFYKNVISFFSLHDINMFTTFVLFKWKQITAAIRLGHMRRGDASRLFAGTGEKDKKKRRHFYSTGESKESQLSWKRFMFAI